MALALVILQPQAQTRGLGVGGVLWDGAFVLAAYLGEGAVLV